MISERDLVDLCSASLRSSIRDKLEHHEFVNVNQLLQRVIESCIMESCDAYKSNHHNVYICDDHSDFSNDENREVFPAKIKWLIENKIVTCPSLIPFHKN
jgi:hypothetical protein